MDLVVPKQRLRTLLTVPFTLLILLPALIIAFTSLYTGLKAVDSLSERVIADVSERVEQAAVHQLEEATITLRTVMPNLSDSFDGSVALFKDRAAIEKKLFELTAKTRTTNYLYFGAEDGSFLGVERARPGAALPAIVRVGEGDGKPRRIYKANAPLDRSTLAETESRIYDPRVRPWYSNAKQALGLAWTRVYISFASGALVTTAAQPVVTRDGKLLGALAADVELSEISSFMKTVSVSENGIAFIVDHEGYLVASSAPGKPFRAINGAQERIRIEDSENAIERDVASWWRAKRSASEDAPNQTHAIGQPYTAKISSQVAGAIDVASRHISRIQGVDWDIVVAIPRSDLTAPIVRSAVIMFAIVVAALIASLQLGLWIVRRVTKDVDSLVEATEKYSLSKDVFEPPKTTLRETSTLAASFTNMFERLRESLVTIRKQNEDLATLNASLEARVETRTKQIEAQNLELTTEVARRERLETDLRTASEVTLKQADDKARFLAMLSHELRTPLQAVIATSELLAKKSSAHTQESKVLDSASKSVLALVDGILSYSKLEAGKVSPHYSSFELEALVEEAVGLARVAQPTRRAHVSVSLDPNLPVYLRSDAGMLRQLIVNLVGNAIKHAEGGEVVVTLSRLGNDKQASPSKPFLLHVSVADDGPGIPEEAKHRLFQPFEQIGRGSADPGSGSGLGLAICAMLVRALGGQISLVSGRETGAEIEFTVNVQRAESPDELSVSALGTSATKSAELDPRLSVLLVDDHRINLRLVSQLLGILGHEVTTAESGEEAISVVTQALARFGANSHAKTFDVVLMDLNLPGISGIDAVNAIRSLCEANAAMVPAFVALTASTTDIDRARCELAGMSHRVTKPATIAALRAVLRTVSREKNEMNDEKTGKPMESANVLDETILQQLLELERQGRSRFVGPLIEDFLSGLDGEFDSVITAIKTGNEVMAFKQAHALAGAALSVGARSLAQALKKPHFDASQASVPLLQQHHQQTKTALNEWLKKYAGAVSS